MISTKNTDRDWNESFIDYSLMQGKPSSTVNDIHNDPLLIDASAFNVKKEPDLTSHKFFGRITLEICENITYNCEFICDKCSKSFSQLEQFVDHITKNYLTPTNENEKTLATAEADIKTEIRDELNTNDVYQLASTTESSFIKFEITDAADQNDNDDKLIEISEAEDEFSVNEPNTKKTKLKRNRSLTLSFDYPDREYVVFFLELLKTHAILWLKKHSTTRPFTEASNMLINEFKAKFPDYNLSKLNLKKAIERMKSTYESARDSVALSSKYSDFLKICAEIVENSKKIEHSCHLCKCVFYKQQELQIHQYKRHKIGELPYKCEHCGYGFFTQSALSAHEDKHNRVKSFECEICGSAFYSETKLLAHNTQMHSEDCKPVCEVCGVVCSDRTRFRQHMLMHKPKNQKCKICNKSFTEKWQLRDHMKVHENKRTYICNLCGKGFNQHRALYIHKRCVHKMKATTSVWKTENSREATSDHGEDEMPNNSTQQEFFKNHYHFILNKF